MNRCRIALSLLLIGLGACQDSSEGRRVAGRTRSLSASGTPQPREVAEATLRLTRERVQATGEEAARVTVRLGRASSPPAVVRLPDGSERPCSPDGDGAQALRIDLADPAAPLTGGYTLVWLEADGTARSLTLLAAGEFPAWPQVASPTELALVPAAPLQVRWDGQPALGPWDLRLDDPASGEVLREEGDLSEQEATIPALPPARRLRLTVTCASGTRDAAVRWESGSSVLLDSER